MKQFLLYLLLVQLLWACTDDPVVTPGILPRSVTVEVRITPEAAEQVTRATDETTITDINFYLFGRTNGLKLHLYSRANLLRFDCPPGEYDLFVAANLHADLGDKTLMELSAYTIAYKSAYADLPMSAQETVTISGDSGGPVTLPSISVRRNMAKIAYNIRVDAAVSDIRLASVQVMNLPGKTFPFQNTAKPSVNTGDYLSAALTSIPAANAGAFSGIHYLFENLQGSVPSIVDQSQKSAANAPKFASYLLIRAMRGAKALAYTVYFGQNNTDNFDVRRNSFHTLNITIKGDNEIDTRVSSYAVTVSDDIEAVGVHGGYCYPNMGKSLFIDVQGESNMLQLYAEVKVTKGDAAALVFSGAAVGTGRKVPLPDSNGKNTLGFTYDPTQFTTATSTLAYTVTVSDDYGISQQFSFEYRFGGLIGAWATAYSHTNGKGAVTVSGALFSQQIAGLSSGCQALCAPGGCTFTANPDTRFRFDGWYSDPQFTKQLTASATYAYRPAVYRAEIYAKFTQVADIPLDGKGTSNCYITPGLNTWYSFDATTMGNGAWTKNIIPRKLSGTNAKVIWETGTVRGAVIKNAVWENNRIYIETGATSGNAVVGLFNSSGECLWSWHIWATNYDPTTTAQLYASGAAFMDRNLGALTTDYTQLSWHGLYYQWGRKDPFIYPRSFTVYTELAPVVYADGFNYYSNHPEYNEETQMTVEWSIKHPTAYMNCTNYQDWDDMTNIPDWLSIQNPNLWGNTSSPPLISSTSTKTIYDPCPPGWRVPDLEKFKGITNKSITKPYYATVYYNGAKTTNYPLGGYFNGAGCSYNGNQGCVYTCSPYYWGGSKMLIFQYECSSINFSTSVGSWSYFRYAADPVRCIKE